MHKILIVEDDTLLANAIQQTLEGAGFEVTWSADAEGARQALAAGGIEMAFLDIMISGETNGLQLLSEIRTSSDQPWRRIPIVMLTNFGEMDRIDSAMAKGASDYLIKSNSDLEKLVEMAKKHLHAYFS
jgi:two-component system OmpR family response regulator